MEEWLSDHCTAEQYRAAKSGEPVPSSIPILNKQPSKSSQIITDREQSTQSLRSENKVVVQNLCQPTSKTFFRYMDHHTIRNGGLALVFESLDGRITATAFFNISLKNNRGKSYPSGKRGQFIPPEMGKFRKLWKRVVGKPPTRWCRVHKFMRSNFREIIFTAQLTEKKNSKGQRYYKLHDVDPRN